MTSDNGLTHQYPDFWHELAKELGQSCQVVANEERRKSVFFIDPAGRKMGAFLIHHKGKWLMQFYATYPYDPVYGMAGGDNLSIEVSEKRPAKHIAGDVKRKFLPAFIPEWDKRQAETTASIARWEQVTERLCELIPGLDTPDMSSRIRLKRFRHGGNGEADISPAGSVKIEFYGDMDDPLTIQMLLTLFRYAPKGEALKVSIMGLTGGWR